MQCPICGKPVSEREEERSDAYPFCSERCKLIDLGRWLRGKYQIPVVDREDESDGGDSPPADK
jgi:hypothetical protein